MNPMKNIGHINAVIKNRSGRYSEDARRAAKKARFTFWSTLSVGLAGIVGFCVFGWKFDFIQAAQEWKTPLNIPMYILACSILISVIATFILYCQQHSWTMRKVLTARGVWPDRQ